MDTELLTADEVASRLRVKPATITAWARQGRIPAHRFSRKVLRFRLSEVMAALGQADSDRRRGHVTLNRTDAVDIEAN